MALNRSVGCFLCAAVGLLASVSQSRGAQPAAEVPAWVTFPGKTWTKISPEEAGFDVPKLDEAIKKANIKPGTWGGVEPNEHRWGAVLTRGGYMVRTWGDPAYKYQSASLGKCITRALLGISVARGVIKLDDPINKTWTGRGELSHEHKYLDVGHHARLTWRHLIDHQGGFILESGYHWRTGEGMTIMPGTVFKVEPPKWVKWTKDPVFDNYAHTEPGTISQYSSGGYWRLAQALTAAWDRDLKEVIDEELFRHMDIPADRWEWTPGKTVHDTRDWYPAYPGYGEYVDPPYTIKGHTVRGAPGWVVMSSEDLARFGLLVATRGVWKGKQLVPSQWLQGHAGLDVHIVAGDPDTMVSIAKINTKNFPFGAGVGFQGKLHFPKELVVGPVKPPASRTKNK